MSLTIPFKYDIGQIIASLKGNDPKLWEALNKLNTATRDLNTLVGNLKALSLYERIIFSLPIDAAGTDILRYVVKIPVDENNAPITTSLTITGLLITTKVIPLVSDVINIQVSNDRGANFRTILKDTSDPNVTYDFGTLITGQTSMQYGSVQFAVNTFNDNDVLRVDWISGTNTDEVTVSLIGNYSL